MERTNGTLAQVAQIVKAIWQTVKPWAERNVTFSLLLAVLTEVPRWTFAFRAVNEPLWAGIPLAILIAFAAAHAWEEYFAEHDLLLLALNVISLVFAVFTIAPVLFAMIESPAHEVSIANIFGPFMKGVWASVLACTTFLPLIQLAVVEARRRERVQVDRLLRVIPQPAQAPKAQGAPPSKQIPERKEVAQSETKESAQCAGVAPSISLDELRSKAQVMRSSGKTLDDIAAQVGKSTTWVSRNTQAIAS
jgi:hypothetical protein